MNNDQKDRVIRKHKGWTEGYKNGQTIELKNKEKSTKMERQMDKLKDRLSEPNGETDERRGVWSLVAM